MIADTPLSGDKITDDGVPTDQFQALLESIERHVNLNTPIIGTGSPEGVIPADPTQLYMDDAGIAGSILYIKQSGSGDTGWILV